MQLSDVTKDNILDEEIFKYIFSIEDEFEREQLISKISTKAKTYRISGFKKILDSYKNKLNKNNKQEIITVCNVKDIPLENLEYVKYKINNSGVFDSNDNCVCPHPIIVSKRYINVLDNTEKIELAWKKDDFWKTAIIDKELIASTNKIIQLSNRGIEVTSLTATSMVQYLSYLINNNIKNIPVCKSINKMGWHEKDFIPYVNDITYDGDMSFSSIYNAIKEYGDYDKWLIEMKIIRENKITKFLQAVSFASPLLELLNLQCFVCVLYGTTGDGKTVAAMSAMSIWGDPAEGKLTNTLNSTDNARFRTLGFLNNIPFFADELETIRNEDINKIIMNITEGIERAKATINGGVLPKNTWKNTVILTGEDTAIKSNSGGGTKNRVIEINSNGKIIENGNRTATIIRENYGFAGKIFIEYVKNNTEYIKKRYNEILIDIKNKKRTETKQAQSMAVIILADEIACTCIFNELPILIDDVLNFMFDSDEIDISIRAYDFLIGFVGENPRKFPKHRSETPDLEIWGKIDGNILIISKNKLEEVFEKNRYPLSSNIKKWDSKELMLRNSQNRILHQTTLGNIKSNCYQIIIKDEYKI